MQSECVQQSRSRYSPKAAELKLLSHAAWRAVGVIAAFDQFEGSAEHFAKRDRVVADDRQPAASFGTIRSEGPDDDVAAGVRRL